MHEIWYLDKRLDLIDHKLDLIIKNLGNPVDKTKINALKQDVDIKRAELQSAINANKP